MSEIGFPKWVTRRILGLETSCDETAASVVEFRYQLHSAHDEAALFQHRDALSPSHVRVLSHVVESQQSHQVFGGVVPEVAARDHLARVHLVVKHALDLAELKAHDLSEVAVTMGPGLIGPLMVGVLFARGFARAAGLPLNAINHVDAHLSPVFFLPVFRSQDVPTPWHAVPAFVGPALGLTVSGGHCHLLLLHSPVERALLGRTADDACGEAFDKAAKLLGLPYPGGPHLDALAQECPPERQGAFRFPHTLQDKSNRFGFSFSGTKTSFLDAIRRLKGHPLGKISAADLPHAEKAALAWGFQEAAIGQLMDRLSHALRAHPDVKSLCVAGGVAANSAFREKLKALGVEVVLAPLPLCGDNATMIALQAGLSFADGFLVQPFSRYPA